MQNLTAQLRRPHLRSPRPLAVAASLLAIALAGCGGGGGGQPADAGPPESGEPAPSTPPAPPAPLVSCTALGGQAIAAAQIGLPSGGAQVVSATGHAASDAGNTLGDYCAVRGTIQPVDPNAPVINFAVNLPTAWNGKGIHFGGGGFNGRLIDGTEPIRFGPATKPAPLALGYATWGDDSGHQSGSITDGTFAMNDEALANYGGQSLKKTHDVALRLIDIMYGRAPQKAYFLGTSTGGRDALAYIQRWPADYQGVIANEPALNYTGTRLSNVATGRALYANGGAGWMNVAKTLLVQKTVLAACDRLDGAADGIISNVESCRPLNTQILSSLRCPGGTDTGDTCLSDAQLSTVRTIESPLELTRYTLADGVTRAGGYNFLEGALIAGPYTTRDLGSRPVPANPATSADANMFVTGDQWTKYFVTRTPNFDSLGFDPLDPGSFTARVTAVARITDATNADLSPFLSRGGKLILLHGLADEVISPNSTIDYYQRVVATVGQPAVNQGIRFYTVPGMGHGTGVFIPNWDSLAALEAWVEQGVAPGTGIAVDGVASTYGRTRPLCQYPAWPKYNGSGSLDAAVNYSCVQETVDPLACPNLPAGPTSYKGGNALGEELTVMLDPATLSYTVTLDASLQRAPGTQRSGQLQHQSGCSYRSDEAGAPFTFASGGVLQGGVTAPTGAGFTPLLAFEKFFENAATPAVFNPAADIYNVIGVQTASGGQASGYGGSGRLRNAGTFQLCQAPDSGGFITYDPACSQTAKGYITYNEARKAFDLFTTSPTGSAVTTGGKLTGSVIVGAVGSAFVPLQLVRDPAGDYGMRLYLPQKALASGAMDGSYTLLGTGGASATATLDDSGFNRNGTAISIAKDAPALGVVALDAGLQGHLLAGAGILGHRPPASTGVAFELGVRN